MIRAWFISAFVLIAAVAVPPDQSAGQPARARRMPAIDDEAPIRTRINAWTVGFAAGLIEGAPLRFANDIARVVNGSGAVHVPAGCHPRADRECERPALSQGHRHRYHEWRSLDEYRSQVPQITQRIVHILNLFPSELHVFVRPEILPRLPTSPARR
jgi:hypothetical protein